MKTRTSLALTLLLGCHPTTTQAPPEFKTPLAPTTEAAATLPAGVLAQGAGLFGLVQVIEHEGLRLLTIDGVVQGAQLTSGDLLRADPMVELLLQIKPDAKTALVIGLGTGQTAQQLAAKGVKVEVVEIEPLVASYAKQFFGFTGQAIVADGLTYMKQSDTTYDLVLMDATTGDAPPKALMTQEAVSLMRQRCGEEGVLAARLLAKPDDPEIQAYIKRLGPRHYAGFGSGLANEAQNIYAFGSAEPLTVYSVKGLMVRPISLAGYEVASSEVSLVGYLVRLSEDGSLALDLPHAEMGAVRFILTGPEAAALEALLPATEGFPTTGEISSDGDTSKTLQGLLGGGGVKRSDVRFSSVMVALEGSVQFRAAVDPERVFAGKILSRQGPGQEKAKEPLLPYGGVLYELRVEKILGSYDQRSWKALSKKLSPSLDKTVKALKQGDLTKAAPALTEYSAGLQAALGPLAERLLYAQTIKEGLTALESARTSLGAKPTPLAQGVACDRLSEDAQSDLYWSSVEYHRLRDAFTTCAVLWYVEAAAKGPGDAHAELAAGRLLELYGWRNEDKEAQALQKRFEGLAPLEAPPTLPDSK